jgi:hypothetical protein
VQSRFNTAVSAMYLLQSWLEEKKLVALEGKICCLYVEQTLVIWQANKLYVIDWHTLLNDCNVGLYDAIGA